MSKAAQIEKELLDLPPEERERLALVAWESLDEDYIADDAEGDRIAQERSAEIESDKVKPIDHAAFLRATASGNE